MGRKRQNAGKNPARATPRPSKLAKAMQLHRAGQLQAAAALYKKILKRQPQHTDALHFLGVLSHQLGKPNEAVDLIRQALALAPDYVDAHNNLGNVLQEQGAMAEAAEAYRRVIALNPAHAQAHNNLGAVLRDQGQYEAAVDSYRRAIALQPHYADAYQNLGNALKHLQRHDDAIAAYRQALALDPRHGSAYDNLGRTLFTLGRVDEAAAVYRSWLTQDADNAIASHMLAACSNTAVPERASDAYVRQVFDDFASTFDNVLRKLDYQAPQRVHEAVRQVYGAPQGALNILDAGCGTGLCGPLLAPYARRLTGVDLSGAMLCKARDLGHYDQLIEAELTTYLQTPGRELDLIVAADTLVYFGRLTEVLRAAAGALVAGGRLIFTLESCPAAAADNGYRLNPHGRYSHVPAYIKQELINAGCEQIQIEPATLRLENGRPVAGLVVRAAKG